MLTAAAFWQRPLVSAAALGSILAGNPVLLPLETWRSRAGRRSGTDDRIESRTRDPASTRIA